ncbi:unnamed protein product [Pocillopora meandrina]|uniref:Uncharacterized protein n=1 Tax=Pocillopora meandrina TaxID=46732 RepID=A0AAU9W7M8_9CNID|nr:unnamed protein product [Pocillopora meandrina]
MGDLTTFKRIQNYIPGLTQYRFKVARQHSLQYGRGTLLPRPRSLRMQVEDKQLDHFLSCITSPHVIQDVPFGQRYLRLSSGKILETPSVIRTIIPNKLLKQYQAYCEETEFTPFSPATMLRVLYACAASVRTSVQGLDYIASDGAKGTPTQKCQTRHFKNCVLDKAKITYHSLLKDDNSNARAFAPRETQKPDGVILSEGHKQNPEHVMKDMRFAKKKR